MPRTRFTSLSLLLLSMIVPTSSLASEPVAWASESCVLEGMLFSLHPSREGTKAYLMKPNTDLQVYEGKKLRVRGTLFPGDRVDLKLPQGIEVLGECDSKSVLAIAPELAWAYEERAQERLGKDDLEGALRQIDRAIRSDGSRCSFHLTRAVIQDRRGLAAESAESAATAVGCLDRYPDLDRAGDLLEKAGRREEAVGAYRKAASLCGYPPDKAKIEAKIGRLD
jgi:tetratricopeptide (TPR) repeat protein